MIHVILNEGKDCIGCAKTGSGKTAAFALPVLQKLAEDPHGVFALVLTPTRLAIILFIVFQNNSCRELAYQIADQFRVFSRQMSYKDCVIVGGVGNLRDLTACVQHALIKLLFVTIRYDEAKFRIDQTTTCDYRYAWSSCCSPSSFSICFPQED